MPPTKLWLGIKICTFLFVCLSVCTYNTKYCVRNSSYTSWWILFKRTHSDQHDMKMTVNIGFCDAASFTWVIGLCQLISKFIIINIPSGDARLCEKILRKSFTWLHNQRSWQRAVYGRASVSYGHISCFFWNSNFYWIMFTFITLPVYCLVSSIHLFVYPSICLSVIPLVESYGFNSYDSLQWIF